MNAVSLRKYRHICQCLYYTNRMLLDQQNTHLRFYRSTHYDTLNLKPEATQQEIKNAYILLSKQLHPDINNSDPCAHMKFTELTNAYELLSDPNQRSMYDVEMKFNKKSNNQIRRQYNTTGEAYGNRYYQHDLESANKIKQEHDSKLLKTFSLLFIVQVCFVICGMYFSSSIKSPKESHKLYQTEMLRGMHEFNEKMKQQQQIKMASVKDAENIKR